MKMLVRNIRSYSFRSTISLSHSAHNGIIHQYNTKFYVTDRPSFRWFSNCSGNKDSVLPKTVISNHLVIDNCSGIPDRIYPRYGSVNNSKLKKLIWPSSGLRNVFLMKKPHNDGVTSAMVKVIKYLGKEYPQLNVIVTKEVADELIRLKKSHGLENVTILDTESHIQTPTTLQNNVENSSNNLHTVTLHTDTFQEIIKKADLLVTLGGDGTILKSVSLFADHLVPPVLSFSLGTLGFLLPYDFSGLKKAFENVYKSNARVLQRSRLECHIIKKHIPEKQKANEENKSISDERLRVHAMNDIILHRGSIPHLVTLDVYIDGEFLTRATGDGLIISLPTGSTAYSLSAGGSIVHPLVRCILLTPVCPRSLSFRPLIIPSTSHIKIKVQRRNSKTRPPNRCPPDEYLFDSPGLEGELSDPYSCHDNHEILPNQITTAKLSIDGASHVSELSIGDEIHIFNEIGTIFIPGSNLPDYIIKSASSGIAPQTASKHGDGAKLNPVDQFLVKLNKNGTKSTNYGGITSGTIIENEHKGVYCVAKGENDWTKGINESLGFNSRFKESRRRRVFDDDDDV